MLDPSGGLALFTDGSCWTGDRVGGWGWVAIDAFDGEESFSGNDRNVTSNVMELRAISEGLEYLYGVYGPQTVLVYSDSSYARKGATHRHYARNVNQAEWARLDKAVDRHEHVAFKRVKGHTNSYYNNLADELAGKARIALQLA